MKILILTTGTRGDVQIYIGLAQMLKKSGHFVTIGTSKAHEKLVRSLMVDYECIDDTADIGQINNVIEKKGLQAVKEGIRLLFDGMFQSHNKILKIMPQFDVIIGHGWLGEAEAELCNKKFIRVGISPNIAEKIKSKTTSFNRRMMIDIENYALSQLIIKPYNDFRNKINAKTITLSDIYKKPLLIPISKVLIDSMDLWNNNTFQSSYWYTDYSSYEPPEKLLKLLNNGKKSILVNVGSMITGFQEPDLFIELLDKIATYYNINVIFLGRNIFNKDSDNNDNILQLDEAPLSYLLPKVEICLHHCGLGTTSDIIRSGIPSIPIPFIIDQFQWAKKLIKMGIATKVLNYKNITEKELKNRMNLIFNNNTYKNNALKVKAIVEEEITQDRTVEIIEKLFK